jgi:hypothetical protein
MNEIDRYKQTLAKIAALINEAINEPYSVEGGVQSNTPSNETPSCTLRFLPQGLLLKAAQTAIEINPVNAPVMGPLAAVGADLVSDPLRAAVVTSKYWGATPRRLSVSFMEPTPSDLRRKIVSHLNAWTRTGCIEFVETQGTGEVRISRGGGGYWSYLGTDVRLIPLNEPTMSLEGFTMNTSDSEFRRVVRHEAGHTLGMPHEHMRRELIARIDREKAYEYFRRTQGWDRPTVDQQVLTSLDDRTIVGTAPDQTSIMCYQLPGSITSDGKPIVGGIDINPTDSDFIGRIYPRVSEQQSTVGQDWEREYAAA